MIPNRDNHLPCAQQRLLGSWGLSLDLYPPTPLERPRGDLAVRSLSLAMGLDASLWGCLELQIVKAWIRAMNDSSSNPRASG